MYDRVADADVRVKSDVQITSMMARKQSYYSERTVYSWVTEDDLEMELLDAVRDALRANDADHPWLSLSDGELLRAARLYGRDQLTGERGFNLAAVALLGKGDTILDVMPLYRTDAVLRRVETGCVWQEFCRHIGMTESTLWHRLMLTVLPDAGW